MPDKHTRAPDESSEPAPSDTVLEIEVPAGREDLVEIVTALLYAWGSEGSSIESRGELTVIVAWILDPVARASAREAIEAVEQCSVRESSRPRVDWLAHYEQSLVAIEVGERFVVAPTDELVAGSSRMAIVIPQEQAFGTGSHETTSICIELLETLDVEGKRGADIGTGSGILAIAMAKLGAARVVAFDNDVHDTWGIVRRNMSRNGVEERAIAIFFGSAEALRAGNFDVATMNILPHVIIELLPHVRTLMAPGAPLVLSGILTTQKDDVITAASRLGMRLTDERSRGEWWGGVVRRIAN